MKQDMQEIRDILVNCSLNLQILRDSYLHTQVGYESTTNLIARIEKQLQKIPYEEVKRDVPRRSARKLLGRRDLSPGNEVGTGTRTTERGDCNWG